MALLALDLLLLAGVDWLTAVPGAHFDAYSFVYSWATYILVAFWACALIARMQGEQADTRTLLVVLLAAVPLIIVAAGLVLRLSFMQGRVLYVLIATAAVLIGVCERATRSIFGRDRFGTLVVILVAIVGVPWFLQERLYLDPHLWTDSPDEGYSQDFLKDRATAESLLFAQADRIADAVENTAEQRPALVDTYYVGFAGVGAQSVFRNEALFGEQVFRKRFGFGERAIELINDEKDRDTYPLATVSGLRYALQLLGERMDRNDDVLVLLLTSHGSQEEGVAVENGQLPLVSLGPDELRSALDDSGIKWRVVIVSACYAGVFLEPLKTDSTLVITAADATHTSFGCADDRDLTYFGEAFLRDALPGSRSLEDAFAKARGLIAEREAAENLTPSMPQIFVGSAIRQKLAPAAAE